MIIKTVLTTKNSFRLTGKREGLERFFFQQSIEEDQQEKVTESANPTSGQTHHNSPSFIASISDGIASHDITARCDDGSDNAIASFRTAEAAVLHGNGFMKNIKTISVLVLQKA